MKYHTKRDRHAPRDPRLSQSSFDVWEYEVHVGGFIVGVAFGGSPEQAKKRAGIFASALEANES